MLRRLIGILIWFGLALPAAAKTGYLCDFQNLRDRGFILTPFVFVLEADGRTARVMDPLILGEKEMPIEARVRRRTQGDLQLTWSVNGIGTTSNGADISVSYTSNFDPGRQTITTRGNLLGFPQIETARGTCQILTKEWVDQNTWINR